MFLVNTFNRSNSKSQWDQLFDHALASIKSTSSSQPQTFKPKADILKSESGYVVRLDLPGVEKNDVEISAHEGELRIHAKRHESTNEETQSWVRRETLSGEFTRVFSLPDNVDENDIKASLSNGVLHIELTETKQVEAQPKKISIE